MGFNLTPKQNAAIRKVQNHKYFLAEGGSRCFVSEQKVFTVDGSEQIGNLKEGDIVLSVNDNGKEEYKPITEVHKFTGNTKPMIKLKLSTGESIEGTLDHEIYFQGAWITLQNMIECYMEIWKSIPGFSKYEASSQGRLRSIDYKRSGKKQVLKPAVDQGYLKTMLQRDDGTYKTWRVHRWVALAWLGNGDGLEINHIDGDKLNNCPTNLEYCTRSENLKHAYRTGLEKAKKGQDGNTAKLTNEQVFEIRAYVKEHGKLKNRKTLATKYGVTEGHLKDIVSQRRGAWSHI